MSQVLLQSLPLTFFSCTFNRGYEQRAPLTSASVLLLLIVFKHSSTGLQSNARAANAPDLRLVKENALRPLDMAQQARQQRPVGPRDVHEAFVAAPRIVRNDRLNGCVAASITSLQLQNWQQFSGLLAQALEGGDPELCWPIYAMPCCQHPYGLINTYGLINAYAHIAVKLPCEVCLVSWRGAHRPGRQWRPWRERSHPRASRLPARDEVR